MTKGVAETLKPSKLMPQPEPAVNPYWSRETSAVFESLKSSLGGLSSSEANGKLDEIGPNLYNPKKKQNVIFAFLGQLKSPIMLLLIAAAVLSLALGDAVNASIILLIILASAGLSFAQEYSAGNAVEKLLEVVQSKVTVLRDGKQAEALTAEIVPGDVVLLSAGAIIPADGLATEANNLFVDQAALTGESFPAEKLVGPVAADAEAARRTNTLFAGTHVYSGSGQMLVVQTGRSTEFGAVIAHMAAKPPETDFERGVRQFGHLLLQITTILTLSVFGINVFLHRPVLDSFMFALALAVGLTPQLLPAIISVNLSHGVKAIAKAKVIVKRLNAIENFGSMNLLCSDKTGTLTLGTVQIHGCCDPTGVDSTEVLRLARLNASYQTGFKNPIDEALVEGGPFTDPGLNLVGEIPYDFTRKRLSVLLAKDDKITMITKGALDEILSVCTTANSASGPTALDSSRDHIHEKFAELSNQGLRVLGVASKTLDAKPAKVGSELETAMCFEGLLALGDPIRPGAADAIKDLERMGISLKIITGDNSLAAAYLGTSLGLRDAQVVTGKEIKALTNNALAARASKADIFAEIEPNQKERLILVLQRAGFVVGYIGDGINDGSALHAADVGISVANAVPVAKEAADMVMLEPGLEVLVDAVQEGRRTFANTLKYVYMASSANLGNMFSMAGASLFLPFLPLLPKQVLLNNLLSDLPEMTLAGDAVDSELVGVPRKWNVHFITKFMVVFGALNSASDYATFGFLLYIHAHAPLFRTAWFVENIISAIFAVFVVRTRRPFFKSRPAMPLVWGALGTIALTLILPYTGLGKLLGFVPLSLSILTAVFGIVFGYLVVIETVKHFFYLSVKSV
jgi:Mg2+-importing ATPase